jgi:hypothetical protein
VLGATAVARDMAGWCHVLWWREPSSAVVGARLGGAKCQVRWREAWLWLS